MTFLDLWSQQSCRTHVCFQIFIWPAALRATTDNLELYTLDYGQPLGSHDSNSLLSSTCRYIHVHDVIRTASAVGSLCYQILEDQFILIHSKYY